MTRVLTTLEELRDFQHSIGEKRLGFVPTMGNLHAGHLSLLRIAQQHSDVTIASIFVNPTQFGPNEDLDAYPRTFIEDLEHLQAIGVDAVFFPDERIIYPYGKHDTLSIAMPEHMTKILCGLDRPSHFQGVATVVAKLFQLVKPQVAVFGEKDFQQLAIIRRLNEELFTGITILSGAIIREDNGLALSSRNQYLSSDEKQQALHLNRALLHCKEQLLSGMHPSEVIDEAHSALRQHNITPEYLDFRDTTTLAENPETLSDGILLIAARIGTTRLIDNLRIAV